ncbi:hypothetical protein K2P96_02100 [Patescibacteria group bacterium]|nr:hypothetical protein [Patescibacteria group bacterium]
MQDLVLALQSNLHKEVRVGDKDHLLIEHGTLKDEEKIMALGIKHGVTLRVTEVPDESDPEKGFFSMVSSSVVSRDRLEGHVCAGNDLATGK